MTHEKFIQGIINGHFALNISKIAKTIYPLRECQIRKVKVINVPDNIKDEFITDEIKFDEVSLELGEHGKSLKAKKLKKKKDEEEIESEKPENQASSEESEKKE